MPEHDICNLSVAVGNIEVGDDAAIINDLHLYAGTVV